MPVDERRERLTLTLTFCAMDASYGQEEPRCLVSLLALGAICLAQSPSYEKMPRPTVGIC